jgi:phosphoribosylformylglycinamidine cyclo-ligase
VQVASVVTGIAEACRAVGCALLGGETAEMPGVYAEGAFDLVGTVIGLVDRAALLPRMEAMQPGDVLVGLPSNGPHTNGYSLIRRILADRDLAMPLDDDTTLADALLTPHRCYVDAVDRWQQAGLPLHGLAHITGGGFVDNVPRILPDHLAAQLDTAAWSVPLLFRRLVEWGDVAWAEAYRVWNMGMGMVLVIPATVLTEVQAVLPEAAPIGRLVARAPGAPAIELLNLPESR